MPLPGWGSALHFVALPGWGSALTLWPFHGGVVHYTWWPFQGGVVRLRFAVHLALHLITVSQMFKGARHVSLYFG